MKKALVSLALWGAMTAAQASPLNDYLDKLDAAECPQLAQGYVKKLPPMLLELAPAEYWLQEWLYGFDAPVSLQRLYGCQLAEAHLSREKAFAKLPMRLTAANYSGMLNDYGTWYAEQAANKDARQGLTKAAMEYALAALGAMRGARGDAFTAKGVEKARQAAIAAGLVNPPTSEDGLKQLVNITVRKRLALAATLPEPFKPLHAVYLQGASQ